MLIVCLPGGATEGLCKINARPCDFRIVAGEFWFRPQATTEGWDKRKILATVGPRPDGQVCYTCSNSVRAPEPEPEPATITTKCVSCGAPLEVPGEVYDLATRAPHNVILCEVCGAQEMKNPSPHTSGFLVPEGEVPPPEPEPEPEPEPGPLPWETEHEELQRIVIECTPFLERIWARRKDDTDMIILADLRREECLQMAGEQWPRSNIDEIFVMARQSGRRPMLPFLMNRSYIDEMPRSGDFTHREAAKELRSFTHLSGLGIVPLLVVVTGSVWATQWAPAASKTIVHRYEPPRSPEAN